MSSRQRQDELAVDLGGGLRVVVRLVGGGFFDGHRVRAADDHSVPGAEVRGELAGIGETCQIVVAGGEDVVDEAGL